MSYEALEPIFDRLYPHHVLARAFAPAVAKIKRRVEKYSGMKILDLCCGTGRGLGAFARTLDKPKLLGIDNNPAMIRKAKQNFPKKDFGKARFLRRNVLELKSGDIEFGTYDLALITGGSLHHFAAPERRRLLAIADKALVPGGMLIFDVINRAESKKTGTVHPFVRNYFRDDDGILTAVIYVTHYRRSRIWQQNIVLKWSAGDGKAPRMTCDSAELFPLSTRHARIEAAKAGFRPYELGIEWVPSTYMCFTKRTSITQIPRVLTDGPVRKKPMRRGR